MEAIESCRLDLAALYVQCATEMLVDVLDPLQSALLIRGCIAMQATLLPPPPQLVIATAKRFICALLLDKRLGRSPKPPPPFAPPRSHLIIFKQI